MSKERLKALIVDDEELARKNLQMLLIDYCPEIEIVGMANGPEQAKEKIQELKPDVVFLDIRMPAGSEGFDLLDSIEKRDFLVVFVTAFKDFAIRAFNANAVHYLLKPVDIDDLRDGVEKLTKAHKVFSDNPENYGTYFESVKNLSDTLVHEKKSNKIAISHLKGMKIVEDDSIIHLEAQGNCTMLYFADGSRYLDTRTLKVYENMLDQDKFFRIHKSHIINMNFLKEYSSEQGYYAILKDEKEVPVARSRVSRFVQTLKDL